MTTLHAGMLSIDFVQTRSRLTDPDTSHEAAHHAATLKAERERQEIYKAVRAAPEGLTAREIADATGIDYIEVQRRKSEVAGICITDLRRGKCAVWRAV